MPADGDFAKYVRGISPVLAEGVGFAVRMADDVVVLDSESEIIAGALEEGIPIEREPFAAMARVLRIGESQLIGIARRMLDIGYIRHFGAFFDLHELGFKGYLFGAGRGRDGEKDLIHRMDGMGSVTHMYGRDHDLGLWFTVLLDASANPGFVEDILRSGGHRFVALETTRIIKLSPSFSLARRAAPEPAVSGVCGWGHVTRESALAVARVLQDGVEITRRPFDTAAEALGVGVTEMIRQARLLKKAGMLRRVGASLNHNAAGWRYNSLCAFDLSRTGSDAARGFADRVVAGLPWVSHCYHRRVYSSDLPYEWRYNLYVMIHARSCEDLAKRERFLSSKLPGANFISMRTTAEYKKISFRI